MTVEVCSTGTLLDRSLAEIANDFTERLRPARLADAWGGQEPVPTLRLAALGVRDALGRDAGNDPGPGGPRVILPLWLYGATAIVGPVCNVDASGAGAPCWQCLERRWQSIRPMEEREALERGDTARVAGPAPHVTAFAVEALWRLVVAVFSESSVRRSGQVYQLDLDTLTVSPARLIADSECPTCASPRQDAAAAAELMPQPAAKPAVGVYRLRSGDDLDLPVDGLVNRICGMLGTTRRRNYQCSPTAPVNGFAQIRSRRGLHQMWWGGHADTYHDSERYGLLEGLERYAGQAPRSRRASVVDSYRNLASDALDPSGLAYHPDFYLRHVEANRPYSEDLTMSWVWGYSLRDRRPILVPEQLVYYLDRGSGGKNFVQECSNGCASGSSHEEALLHGMLELIERDAFLLSWYGGARLAEIDLASCRSAGVQFMADRVSLLGYDIRLFDLRSDLPVPAVLAVGARRGGGLGSLCLAAGASLDPEDAVRAALCETASYVPQFDERVEAKQPELREMVADYTKVTELTHHALLYGLPEMAGRAAFLLDDRPRVGMDELYDGWLAKRPSTLDLRDDVEHLVELIAGLGGDVVAVDQTCAEQAALGLRTVCVIAPGLIPIDFGWERQRVLHHPRLEAFIARGTGPAGLGATGLHPHPHPFP